MNEENKGKEEIIRETEIRDIYESDERLTDPQKSKRREPGRGG